MKCCVAWKISMRSTLCWASAVAVSASAIRKSRRCNAAPSFEAAANVAKEGVKVIPEIMIPLVGMVKEMNNQGAIVRRIADRCLRKRVRK